MAAVAEDLAMVRLRHQGPPFRLAHLRTQLE